jgi:hypothetical protein
MQTYTKRGTFRAVIPAIETFAISTITEATPEKTTKVVADQVECWILTETEKGFETIPMLLDPYCGLVIDEDFICSNMRQEGYCKGKDIAECVAKYSKDNKEVL